MKYKALFTDTFLEVEADSEEEAQRKALEKLLAQIKAEDLIVWAEPDKQP